MLIVAYCVKIQTTVIVKKLLRTIDELLPCSMVVGLDVLELGSFLLELGPFLLETASVVVETGSTKFAPVSSVLDSVSSVLKSGNHVLGVWLEMDQFLGASETKCLIMCLHISSRHYESGSS